MWKEMDYIRKTLTAIWGRWSVVFKNSGNEDRQYSVEGDDQTCVKVKLIIWDETKLILNASWLNFKRRELDKPI